MRLLCNMIVDIHCNLCIGMVSAPLRLVLNGCPPDIQHPITYCITFGLTLFSPNLVHPVCRRICEEICGIRFSSLCLRNASYTIFRYFGSYFNSAFQLEITAQYIPACFIFYDNRFLRSFWLKLQKLLILPRKCSAYSLSSQSIKFSDFMPS